MPGGPHDRLSRPGFQPHRRSIFLLGATSVGIAIGLLFTAMPAATALVIKPSFHTPCYGSSTFWGYISQHGQNFGGGPWAGNYTAGQFIGANISSAAGAQYGANQSWIWEYGGGNYGPGPSNSTCFQPVSNTTWLEYVFTNFSWTVHYRLICPTANASGVSGGWNISIGGNLYDYSTPHHVFIPGPSTAVAQGRMVCSKAGTTKAVRHYHLNGPFIVRAHTSSLAPADRYFFIAQSQLATSASALSTNSTANAWFTAFSDHLSAIRCPGC